MPQALSFSQVSNMNFSQFKTAIQVRDINISPTNIRRAWNVMVAASEYATYGQSETLLDSSNGCTLCQTVSAVTTKARFMQRTEMTASSFASTLSQVRKVFALITHWNLDASRAIPANVRKNYCTIKTYGDQVKLINFPVFDCHTTLRNNGFHWANPSYPAYSNVVAMEYSATAALSYVTRSATRVARMRRTRRNRYAYAQAPVSAPVSAPVTTASVVLVAKPKFFDNPFMGMSAMAVFALQADA